MSLIVPLNFFSLQTLYYFYGNYWFSLFSPSNRRKDNKEVRMENLENSMRIFSLGISFATLCHICAILLASLVSSSFWILVAFSTALQLHLYMRESGRLISCLYTLKLHHWMILPFPPVTSPLNVPVYALRLVRSTLDTDTQEGMRSKDGNALRWRRLRSPTA